ncbi:STAS domain-containing protein [Streptomyces sp. ZYX-F-203]
MTLTCDRTTTHVTARRDGETTFVELRGEIDLGSAPRVGARLDALTDASRPDLVIDVRGVTFMDCTGLGLLCRARNRALLRQGRCRLITGGGQVPRLLRATGLDTMFEPCRWAEGIGRPTRSAETAATR